MLENSAETTISVESAEPLEKAQLGIAEDPDTSVDSEEPIEKSSEREEPDVMSLLLDEDEPVGDKSVPEGQYLKLKASNKSMKQELERLRSQIIQPQQQVQQTVQPAPVAEPPDPEKFPDGIYDANYQKAFIEYQKMELSKVVEQEFVQKTAELENAAYLSKYQERIDRSLPIANMRIDELKSKDAGFKERIERPIIQSALAKLSPEAIATIAESDSPEGIINYYTQKPERLLALSNNSVDELVNLGKLIGKIQGIKSSRKAVQKPITPIKSGDNSSKLHPIRDHAKYDHSTVAGHKRWEKDLEELQKGRK